MCYELCVKPETDFIALVELLKEYDITSVCLPNKPNLQPNLEVAKNLLEHYLKLQITLNFAISNYYKRGENLQFMFDNFVKAANSLGVTDFLVVSGSQKKPIDTLQILQSLNIQNNNFYCAYNPFFRELDLQIENQRLIKKLATGKISGVYLQIGSDLNQLVSGLEFIKSLDPEVPIFGSFLIPNSQFANGFKFRPWKGVFLDQKYLNDMRYARTQTLQIREIYRQFDVVELVQITPLTRKNLAEFAQTYADL
jgi:hypothetical protein